MTRFCSDWTVLELALVVCAFLLYIALLPMYSHVLDNLSTSILVINELLGRFLQFA